MVTTAAKHSKPQGINLLNRLTELGAEILKLTHGPNTILCLDSDLMPVQLEVTGEFLPVKKYLPMMYDNQDHYGSLICSVLIQTTDGMDIQTANLMMWKDDPDSSPFWYENDVIEHVIAWMPTPSTYSIGSVQGRIKQLIQLQRTGPQYYWNFELTEVRHLPNTTEFISIQTGIPPLHSTDQAGHYASEQVMVEYEYQTANGCINGTSLSKALFDPELGEIVWDDRIFACRHAHSSRVIGWKVLPANISDLLNPP